MKQKIYLILILLIHFQAFAQSQRFIYEYNFKPDSLNKQNVLKEIMNLDVNQDGSVFYSQLLLDRDSVMSAQIEKSKGSGTIYLDSRNIKKSAANFDVSKKYPTLETKFRTSFNALDLVVVDDKKIDWIILPETKMIEGYKVQKATANYVGRHWTAWFASDIQLQDGPYKFCGLPGLILSVEDEEGDHNFNIVGIKNQYNRTLRPNSKEIIVSPKKFNQLWNEYKTDPAKNIKLIHGSSQMADTILFNSNTGNPMSKQELIKNKEEGDKKYFKYNNNFIERSLYK